jgi:hypothetical protein
LAAGGITGAGVDRRVAALAADAVDADGDVVRLNPS